MPLYWAPNSNDSCPPKPLSFPAPLPPAAQTAAQAQLLPSNSWPALSPGSAARAQLLGQPLVASPPNIRRPPKYTSSPEPTPFAVTCCQQAVRQASTLSARWLSPSARVSRPQRAHHPRCPLSTAPETPHPAARELPLPPAPLFAFSADGAPFPPQPPAAGGPRHIASTALLYSHYPFSNLIILSLLYNPCQVATATQHICGSLWCPHCSPTIL